MEPLLEPGAKDNPASAVPWMFGGHIEPVRLPWTWALERLTQARNYWIATTRPDGRPHSRPVWGIWLRTACYFSTGSLAASNILTNPAITLHLESGNEVVILEGVAAMVNTSELLQEIVKLYNQKYHENIDPDQLPGPFYAVAPQTAFGWLVDPSGLDGGAIFHGTATRWRFQQGLFPTHEAEQ